MTNSVKSLIEDHERYARMFEMSAASLDKVGLESAAAAGMRIADQHREWAKQLRSGQEPPKSYLRELRTQDALRKRGRT